MTLVEEGKERRMEEDRSDEAPSIQEQGPKGRPSKTTQAYLDIQLSVT